MKVETERTEVIQGEGRVLGFVLAFLSRASTRPCWKVSITDNGRGIQTAKGSGPGLSIVHALVTGRYRWTMTVRNRVENDYSRGTTVESASKCSSSPENGAKIRESIGPGLVLDVQVD